MTDAAVPPFARDRRIQAWAACNGVSAAGGVVTVVNGTSANTTTSIAPTSVVANQGDQISLAVTGGGSGGGLTTFSIQARRGTL